jgi:hypothetical protein
VLGGTLTFVVIQFSSLINTLTTKVNERRYKEECTWLLKRSVPIYGEIKHPEDVLALSLNHALIEKMTPLYANVQKAWLTVHPKARIDAWVEGQGETASIILGVSKFHHSVLSRCAGLMIWEGLWQLFHVLTVGNVSGVKP